MEIDKKFSEAWLAPTLSMNKQDETRTKVKNILNPNTSNYFPDAPVRFKSGTQKPIPMYERPKLTVRSDIFI